MSSETKPYLSEMTLAQLGELLRGWDEPPYRAKQIYHHLHRRGLYSIEQMTDLPLSLRERLKGEIALGSLTLQVVRRADQGRTYKALFFTPEGHPVESVLMLYRARSTVCVSVQSGCPVGCGFCATGKLRFRANLTAGQIIEQVWWARQQLRNVSQGSDITNVVFMGMGEPFLNYEAWWQALLRLHDPQGMNLGARAFTVSTVGIVPGIERLSQEALRPNLAVSLHAANDRLRQQLIPIARQYPLEGLFRALQVYVSRTHRRVSFEYVLLGGVNDSADHARELAAYCKGSLYHARPLLCHVNLIPWNPVGSAPYKTPSSKRVSEFQKILQNAGIACTVRENRGVEIGAACGQLAGSQGTSHPTDLSDDA